VDVAQVQLDVHHLVVAPQGVDRAARGVGLLGQGLEEVQDGPIVWPPIDLIPRLDHHQLTADPLVGLVDGPRQAQGGAGGLEITVHIPDGHQPGRAGLDESRRRHGAISGRRAVLGVRRRIGIGGAGERREQQQGEDAGHRALPHQRQRAPRLTRGPYSSTQSSSG
jgi:hypothetical protein